MSENKKSAAIEDMRFRLLIDAVVDYAIYMIDPEGIITSWNSGAKRFKGYEEAEILGYARGLSSGGIDKTYFVAAVPY